MTAPARAARPLDWDDVPPHRRLTAAWLARYRAQTYLAHHDAWHDGLYEGWLQRLVTPSCQRAVVCIFDKSLLAPCALRAPAGSRYCAKHRASPADAGADAGAGAGAGGVAAAERRAAQARRLWGLKPELRREIVETADTMLAWVRRGLSSKTASLLARNGLRTPAEVAHTPDPVLWALRNCGKKTVAEIRASVPYGSVPEPGRSPWWL